MATPAKSHKMLGSFGEVKMDISRLISVEKELGKRYETRVGIMGKKSTSRETIMRRAFTSENGKVKPIKSPSPMTNAEIGFYHEKGSKSSGLPRRSFLELPLQMKLPRVLEQVGPSVIKGLTTENLKAAFTDLGLIAENIIGSAFKTGGFGRWPKLKAATIRRKGSSAILIDTSQLRRSVSSTVVGKDL